MNIVLFTDTYYPELNGVATSVATLAKLLKSKGHNIYVVTTNPFSKKITFKDNVIRIPGVRLKNIYDYELAPIYNRKAMKILKNINPDIIHVNTDFGIAQLAFIYKKMCNAALVYTYHTMYEDYTYYITKGKMDRLSKWIIRQVSLAVSEKAHALISPSKKSLNYLRKIGVNEYINIVPTGLDTTRFLNYKLDKNDKDKFLEEYNIPSNKKIMLFLGRLAKEKNVEELLENFKNLLEERNDVQFVIVGDGPNKSSLEQLAKDLGVDKETTFVGAVPYEKIDFYYSIADVFVNASQSETQGLTYLEAMASKTIVLAKFDSNLSELITDGINGFFFETKEQFLQKIRKIFEISDTTYNVMANSMVESVDKLSLENFYANIMEVYERAKRNNI